MESDEQLKVVHVTRPAQIGGTITSTLRQAQAQFDLGHDVQVLSLIQRQRDQFRQMAKRFTVPAKLVSGIGCAARLVAIRMSSRRRIVHLHSGRSTLSPSVKWVRSLLSRRMPLVVSLHGPSEWEPHDDEGWRSAHVALHGRATAIVVPSEAERQVQIADGIPATKVFVVPDIAREHSGPSGQLRRELELSDRVPVVLFCGRLVPEKGPRKAIEAFRLVLASRPEAVLVVAGDGPLLADCRLAAASLGERVRFLGHVADVGPLYADTDVFVAPSTGESFGISAMEAALSAVPMVLSRIRPWTDAFAEGRECLFVNGEDSNEIARMVLELLNDRHKARDMAAAARNVARAEFSPDAAMTALARVYRFALEADSVP